MRGRLLNDEIAIDLRDSMRQCDDAPAASFPGELSKCELDLRAVVNTTSGNFNVKGPSQALYRSKKFLVCGGFWMQQDQHTSSCRCSFPKHLKPLAAHRALKIRKPGYVATGPRQIVNEAASDWIGDHPKHDGYTAAQWL